MTDASGPRFVIRSPDGVDTPVESVEELQELLETGAVDPDSTLYDASTGNWAPARSVPVFRFIVEELAEEGRLPDALSGLLDTEADEEDGTDPFDFTMDLVDTDPLGSGEGRAASESGTGEEERPQEEGETTRDADFQLDGGIPVPERDHGSPVDGPDGEESDGVPVARDRDRHREEVDDEEDEDDDWFTPAEEGGIALPDPREMAVDDDAPAELWEPEEGAKAEERELSPPSAAPSRRWAVRPGVVVGLVVLVAAVGVWALLPLPGMDDADFQPPVQVTPLTEPPPPPAFPTGLAQQAETVLDHLAEAYVARGDSVREELGLASAPPSVWLSGVYLADADDFEEVRTFWEDYIRFVESLQAIDREIYFSAVEAALDDLALNSDQRQRLAAHFDERYDVRGEYRQERYRHLGQTARAAIRLHEVLIEHQDVIEYSPVAGSGVSADPILEADIPEGPVRREIELALDRVFLALDRSRGGGAPSRDGLRTELFLAFGDY